jgi:hypothetical protein
MTGRSAPLALAMGLLVLSIAVAIVLIPWLDEQLRKAIARKEAAARAANDNARAEAREAGRIVG